MKEYVKNEIEKDFERYLDEEKDELYRRIVRLKEFIGGSLYNKLPVSQVEYLNLQVIGILEEYHEILSVRLSALSLLEHEEN